ncbi:uncharacterized protein LOC144708899 isoform X2 [Wolffia australiana]
MSWKFGLVCSIYPPNPHSRRHHTRFWPCLFHFSLSLSSRHACVFVVVSAMTLELPNYGIWGLRATPATMVSDGMIPLTHARECSRKYTIDGYITDRQGERRQWSRSLSIGSATHWSAWVSKRWRRAGGGQESLNSQRQRHWRCCWKESNGKEERASGGGWLA